MGNSPSIPPEHRTRDVYHALTQREADEVSRRCAALAAHILRRISSHFPQTGGAVWYRNGSERILHPTPDDLLAAKIAARVVRLAYTEWAMGACGRSSGGIQGLDGQDELAAPFDWR